MRPLHVIKPGDEISEERFNAEWMRVMEYPFVDISRSWGAALCRGWIYVVSDMCAAIASYAAGRMGDDLCISGMHSDKGESGYRLVVSTRCGVAPSGIIRKFSAKARCTCTRCGAAGRTRTYQKRSVLLCPICSAGHALRDDLETLNDLLLVGCQSAYMQLVEVPAGLRGNFGGWLVSRGLPRPRLHDSVPAYHMYEWAESLASARNAIRKELGA